MKRAILGLSVMVLACGVLGSSVAHAASPFRAKTTWANSPLAPGERGQILVHFGVWSKDVPAGPLTVEAQLPEGISIGGAERDIYFHLGAYAPYLNRAVEFCTGWGSNIMRCEFPDGRLPFRDSQGLLLDSFRSIYLNVDVDSSLSGTHVVRTRVFGDGEGTLAEDEDLIEVRDEDPVFGVVPGSLVGDVFEGPAPDGTVTRQAGARPFELRVEFDLNRRLGLGNVPDIPSSRSVAPIKTAEVQLPRGFVANPNAVPQCTAVEFAEGGTFRNSTGCPPETQVGYLNAWIELGGASVHEKRIALYNLDPPPGEAADIGFRANELVQGHIYGKPDAANGYAIRSIAPYIGNLAPVKGVEVVIWGVPGDPAHDSLRFYNGPARPDPLGASFNAPIRPFLSMPGDCESSGDRFSLEVEPYGGAGGLNAPVFSEDPIAVTGCDDPRLRFTPSIEVSPTTTTAASPTGLEVDLQLPQGNDTVGDSGRLYHDNGYMEGVAAPPLRKVSVSLPEGMTVSPSSAQGLGSCSLAEIGLGTERPVRCPENSQIGSLSVTTPLFPEHEPLPGRVYLADQVDNPFGTLLALYLVIEDPDRGILVKMAGRVDLDESTGQLTSTFDDLPQFPVSRVRLRLKDGERGGLVTPETCGTKVVSATLGSWHDPNAKAHATAEFEISGMAADGACYSSPSDLPFRPDAIAGVANPIAGLFSPLSVAFARTDDDQQISAVSGQGPGGLSAAIRGVGRCGEAEIAAATMRTAPGEGAGELSIPSCPQASKIGSVRAFAGVGSVLTRVDGSIYLAGPYRGAPLSGVAIVPAVAGPFDLGVVVSRTPAYVDRITAQIRLASDPLPQILAGVPVRARKIAIDLDRPGFVLNPTGCDEKRFELNVRSVAGLDRVRTPRFQIADCARLDFKPKLRLRLKGGVKRGSHPKLIASLQARSGDANIGRAQVKLPRSAFLDQANIGTVCTRVQWAADQCPERSVYGRVKAVTPLLDYPITGNVYLRSSSNLLPDLVADLRGPAHEPIRVELSGKTDSVKGALRNTFQVVPDVSVTSFRLELFGGKRGLIEMSDGFCKRPRAQIKLRGQNGREHNTNPKVRSSCGKSAKRRSGAKSRASRGR